MRRTVPIFLLLAACRAPSETCREESGHMRKVRELVEVEGTRPTFVYGYGLVSDLKGTGDGVPSEVLPYALKVFPPEIALAMANEFRLAIVRVEAELPSTLEEDARLDVLVVAQKEADSLEGGYLHPTVLQTLDSETKFVVASGSLDVGEETTWGTIARGGRALVGYPSQLVRSGLITLSLNVFSRAAALRIADRINRRRRAAVARVNEDAHIEVAVPEELLPDLLDIDVPMEGLYAGPTVWINSATGVVAWEGDVRVGAGLIFLNGVGTIRFEENESLDAVVAKLGPEAGFQLKARLVQSLMRMNALRATMYER